MAVIVSGLSVVVSGLSPGVGGLAVVGSGSGGVTLGGVPSIGVVAVVGVLIAVVGVVSSRGGGSVVCGGTVVIVIISIRIVGSLRVGVLALKSGLRLELRSRGLDELGLRRGENTSLKGETRLSDNRLSDHGGSLDDGLTSRGDGLDERQ